MAYYPRIQLPGARPQGGLALALLVSAAVHLLWLGLFQRSPIHPLPDATPLRLTLVPPKPRVALPSAAASPVPGVVAPARRPARTVPERPSQPQPDTVPAFPVAAPDVLAAPAPEPATAAPPDAPRPARADILAAATRDAAVIARELNHAPGAPQRFRSRAQEELDRRFDAAHAAGGSWFRSARVEEITTAADGNMRVYRIVTPVGTFCRTYPANGSAPMNTTCPR